MGSNFSLRLVGHSLGGGLVLAAAYKLIVAANAGLIPACLKPDRIALLDPYWSQHYESDVALRLHKLAFRHNVTIEMYAGSVFSSSIHSLTAPLGHGTVSQRCASGMC